MKPKIVTTAAIALIGTGAFFVGRSSVSTGGTTGGSGEGDVPSLLSSRSASSGGGDSRSTSRADRGADRSAGSTAAMPGTKEARLAKLESIVRETDPLARTRALLDYLDRLDPSELQDAVDHFRSMGVTQERFGEYAMMLTAWAKADPTGALAYAKEKTNGGFATTAILSSWAGTDPDAAIAWAKANHAGEEGNPYMAGIIRGIASTDPARATSLMTEMPFGEQRGEALAGLMPHILLQGTEATQKWISSIEDERLRNGAMERAVDALASKDPKGTADWLVTNPGDAASRKIDDVVTTWMEKDSSGATAFYQSLPAGEARSNALRGIVNSMAREDPKAAAAFLDRHPADVNDRVVQQFVWNSLQNDPALAVGYISKMGDAGARDGLYRRAIDGWMRTDEAAARNYLQTNRLPDSMQGYVQGRLGR